jgi:hypothetical protein
MNVKSDSEGEQEMNEQPIWSETADFRQHVPEITIDEQGVEVAFMLCEDFTGGRWEPFISYVSPTRARQIIAAQA